MKVLTRSWHYRLLKSFETDPGHNWYGPKYSPLPFHQPKTKCTYILRLSVALVVQGLGHLIALTVAIITSPVWLPILLLALVISLVYRWRDKLPKCSLVEYK